MDGSYPRNTACGIHRTRNTHRNSPCIIPLSRVPLSHPQASRLKTNKKDPPDNSGGSFFIELSEMCEVRGDKMSVSERTYFRKFVGPFIEVNDEICHLWKFYLFDFGFGDYNRSQRSIVSICSDSINCIDNIQSTRHFTEDDVERRERVVSCHNKELTAVGIGA